MKTTLKLLTCLLALLVASSAMAQSRGFGLGIIAGEPTGLSGKIWTGPKTAIDFAAAWSVESHQSFNFHSDYLIHDFGVFKVDKGKMALYYGIGGRLVDAEGDSFIGVRVPIGIDYLFATSPLDIFMEVAPVLNLSPDTDLDFDGGVGIRFWFK
jgi:hypothetical protein